MTASTSNGPEFLTTRFGIIGTGHLGRAFASLLLGHGLPAGNLLVADKMLDPADTSAPAYQAVEHLGLAGSITSNQRVLSESDVVLLMITPQSLGELRGLDGNGHTLVISSLAGVPLDVIRRYFGARAVRIMPSAPDTIVARTGMVAVLPADPFVQDLLTSLGLKPFGLRTEEEMHNYTVGMCLPVMLMMAAQMDLPLDDLLRTMSAECPHFDDVSLWAHGVVDGLTEPATREAYVARMVTSGGITDAVVKTIDSGAPLVAAWRAGLQRSRDIAAVAATQ
jgi:pyrroline-5-carboxylate reductase